MSNEILGNTEYKLIKGTRFVYNNTNWEVVHVNDTALTFKNLDSENQMESLIIEDWQNIVKRGEVEFIAEKENFPVGDIPLSDQLVNVIDMKNIRQKEITDFVADNNFTSAAVAVQELTELNREEKNIRAQLQAQEITVDDVNALRSILPARKSVQNMLEREVAQTLKFEKLLGEEMGAKSAYEMRNSDNAWRKDESKTIPVIKLQKREIPENLSEIRKDKSIPRGQYINCDTGIKIQFSKSSINEIIAKAIPDNKRGVPVDARISALYQMQDLIENAICFDSQISEYDPIISKNKSSNTLFIHRMYGVVNCDGKNYLANFAIEEFYATDKENQFKETLNRLYSFRDIEITPVKLLGFQTYAIPQNASTDTSTGVINISIPQLYNLVKSYDKYFYENSMAAGRPDRESEIKAQNEFSKAMEILSEKGISVSLSQNEFIEKATDETVANNDKNFDLVLQNSLLLKNPEEKAVTVMPKLNPFKTFIDNLKSMSKKQDKLSAPSVQAEEQPEIIKENTVSSKLDDLIEARKAFAEDKITIAEYQQAIANYIHSFNGKEMWIKAIDTLRKQLDECPDNHKKAINYEIDTIERNFERKFASKHPERKQTLDEIKRAAHENYVKMQNEKAKSEKEKITVNNNCER